MKTTLDRRTFLRGMGAVVSLPLLDCMVSPRLQAATVAEGFPLRMGFVYIPNGANMAAWTPKREGRDFDLPPTLKPFQSTREHIQVLSGLDHDKARANGDGPGDHARANATFLTGCQARKTSGADIRIGVSVDQIAAQSIGEKTLLSSLELSCDRARSAGNCDSGYSCAYQYNLSWRNEKVPMPPENNPRQVFEKLFQGAGSGESRAARMQRRRQRKSVLDFVRGDAVRMNRALGNRDREKMDEYFTSLREVERQIEKTERFASHIPDGDPPAGIPKQYQEHIALMFDLLALSYQTDTTRICSFLLAHDGSNRSFKHIGVPEGHHQLSHHRNDPKTLIKIQKIDQFYTEQFAQFLTKLASMKEGAGTVLDHSMIVYGGGISDGNRHNHRDLPVILAGGGCGTLQPGRHVSFDGDIPMTNLYLSMLERMGVASDRIGDSTGTLSNI